MPDGSRVLVSIRIDATPDAVFEAFTARIDRWWRPNPLFRFTRGAPGTLSFEGGADGRLVETSEDGSVFEVGRVRVWDPPHRLVTTWREASFADDQVTELVVRFDQVASQTRVTVEHFGWDAIPQDHAARHGFELTLFQRRFGEWFQALLVGLRHEVADPGGSDAPTSAQRTLRQPPGGHRGGRPAGGR